MQMVRITWVWLLLMLTGAAQGAQQTQARLILDAETARPGDTIMAGIHLHMSPGWHTYWRNAGDSGKGTEIKWTLPQGMTAGAIQWPVPEKLMEEDLTTYVYHGDVILLVPLILAKDLPEGELTLKASVSWLECEKMCLPGKEEVQGKLRIASEAKPSTEAARIEKAKARLPQDGTKLLTKAWWEKASAQDSRPLVIEWPGKAEGADFYPYENDSLQIKGESEVLPSPAGTVRLRKVVQKLEGNWPAQLAGLAIEKPKGAEMVAYETRLAISAGPAASPASAAPVIPAANLLLMLGLAFVGGLILNIMPCVLPVISLKILSFVKQSRESPGEVRKLGLIYVVGVLCSFLVLAGIVIGVQMAGGAANWGMQFQNPKFLVGMTVLVTLVALNLFGVFEVNLGGKVMNSAGELASKSGAPGAFFNGVLATLLATPCTAPVLAPALGFAFAQPPAIIVLMFLMVGLGLAAPYILLSFQPGWLRFLPKPGAWMERFKVIMGFPMLATAFWLFTLTSTHLAKSGTLWFGIFLVSLALAAWIWGEFVQRGSARKGLAIACSAVLVLGMGAYAVQQRPGIQWQPWTPQAVKEARAAGRPVLVDFTADWCLTCQLNKRSSLEVPAVESKLKDINAVTLIGDYTRENPLITEELKRYERAGVPLVLVFPKDATVDPIVLPSVLTKGIVLDALARAASSKAK